MKGCGCVLPLQLCFCKRGADEEGVCKHASRRHVVTTANAHARMMCIASEKRFFIPVAFCLSLTLLLSLSRRHVIIAS